MYNIHINTKMRLLRRGCSKYLYFVLLAAVCILLIHRYQIVGPNHPRSVQSSENKIVNLYFPDTQATVNESTKIFWQAKVSLAEELARSGLGEHGVAASMPAEDPILKKDLWDVNGFNAMLSDQISLQRSLQDIRHHKCASIKYNSVLPTVSVVIPFFEEHLSTLLRTVHSVINRSPPSLLKEIILVDDGSTMKEDLREPLDQYLRKTLPWVMVVRLPERVGLIVARLEGIKVAKAEVVVVLDSHCEVMTDWLPPLLEPIVVNPRTAVCPYIDVINSENFAYAPQDEGARGGFDWRFYYKRLPLREHEKKNLPAPFENPVMNGGLFAMNRKWFWELGGYDPGLKIWGGEQYDLSFKIWQCGGRMLDAPCSRVGHIFRKGGAKRPAAKNAGNFLSINYKRVALVWMDEYIESLYRKNPKLRDVDPGDYASELEIREQLKCKPFKWFLENVAPDLVKEYPPEEPPDFANGTIKSMTVPTKCVDSGSRESGDLILYPCHGLGPQFFISGWQRSFKVENEQFCWSAPAKEGQPPQIQHCTKPVATSQMWRYDPESQHIQENAFKRCLDLTKDSSGLAMMPCDWAKASQRWQFLNVNARRISMEFPAF